MGYEVVSRFYDRDRDRYVDPGQPCPALSEETAARLVRAGCLVAAPAARKPKRERKDAGSGAKIRGFGLPLARIYARYFGGELTLKSTEGYGLDAYLHLPMLGTSCERLPLRVRDSPGALVSLPSYHATLAR